MRNSIYTFDNNTNSFYPFICQLSNYQDICNSINIEDPSSISSYCWVNYPSFSEDIIENTTVLNGCWVFNKKTRSYHWDSTIKSKSVKLNGIYQYVGPSMNDMDVHYKTNLKGSLL